MWLYLANEEDGGLEIRISKVWLWIQANILLCDLHELQSSVGKSVTMNKHLSTNTVCEEESAEHCIWYAVLLLRKLGKTFVSHMIYYRLVGQADLPLYKSTAALTELKPWQAGRKGGQCWPVCRRSLVKTMMLIMMIKPWSKKIIIQLPIFNALRRIKTAFPNIQNLKIYNYTT